MSNSLNAFLAFSAFLAFGYLSILRLAYLQQLSTGPLVSMFEAMRGKAWLRGFGSSGLFVALPATSFLLFWGWGIALLWVFCFHLLIESLAHIRLASAEHDLEPHDYLVTSANHKLVQIERLVAQIFFILASAITISLLTSLIEQKSGLLFALFALLPAHLLLHSTQAAVTKTIKLIGVALIVVIGYGAAAKLGFSVYGEWVPLSGIIDAVSSWLLFDNTAFVVSILTLCAFLLNQHASARNDLSLLAGILGGILMFILLLSFLWLRPELDAPLNSIQDGSQNIPPLLSLSVFLSTGFLALLYRVLGQHATMSSQSSQSRFGTWQLTSLLHLFFVLVLILCLAAAVGIGAWKTHYLEWGGIALIDPMNHLDLVTQSLVQLSAFNEEAGRTLQTSVMATICIFGLSMTLLSIHYLLIYSANEDQSAAKSLGQLVFRSSFSQAALIFLTALYLSNQGISLSLWLLFGLLSWFLVVQMLINTDIEGTQKSSASAERVNNSLCLAIILLGLVQAIWLMVSWAIDGEILWVIATLLLLAAATPIWKPSIENMIRRLIQNQDDTAAIFEDDK